MAAFGREDRIADESDEQTPFLRESFTGLETADRGGPGGVTAADFTVSCLSYYDPYHDTTYAAQYLVPLKQQHIDSLYLPLAGETGGAGASSKAPVVTPGAVHTQHKPGDGQTCDQDKPATALSYGYHETNHVDIPDVEDTRPETHIDHVLRGSDTIGNGLESSSNRGAEGLAPGTELPMVWVPGAGVPGSGVPAAGPGETNLGPLAAVLRTTVNPSWKVDYLDFTPELSGYNSDKLTCDDEFPDLVKKVNTWFRQNPQVEVKTCECLTWCSSTLQQVGDSETMVLGKAVNMLPGGDTFNVMGLRVWMMPRSTFGPAQRLRYRDYKPQQGQSLSALMLKANNDLEQNPLAGKLISFETAMVPDLEASDTLYWQEASSDLSEYGLVLRLYYMEGDISRQTLGIHNIVPEVVKGTHEPFSCLMRRASQWVSAEADIVVTNLRSTYLSREYDTPIQAAERCTHFFRNFCRHQYYQILRVFYIYTPDKTTVNTRKHVINCMTFTPVQSSLGSNVQATFEKMKATMLRIGAWIKLSGAKIFSLETVVTPLIPSRPNHTLPEVTYWSQTLTSSMNDMQWKFLLHIRIYIDGEFIDPDPRLLPPLPYSLTRELQNSIEEKEIKRFYKKKKMRKTQNRIAIATFLFILVTVAIVIIIERMLKKYYL